MGVSLQIYIQLAEFFKHQLIFCRRLGPGLYPVAYVHHPLVSHVDDVGALAQFFYDLFCQPIILILRQFFLPWS